MKIIRQYKKLEKHISLLIFAELFIQMINNSFLLIMLVYMEKAGYSDHQGADFVSYRFIGTLLLAFPLGLYVKGRKIRPLFLFGSFSVPLFSLFIIYAVHYHIYWLLYLSQVLWGISFLFFQVTALPYILRNARRDTHTEAISLSFATFSFGGIISGLLIFGLQKINPDFFDEMMVLQVISILGFLSIFFIARINSEEKLNEEPLKNLSLTGYDWKLIFKSLFPVFVITIGAGLTIPFIGIFFYHVHGLDSDEFAFYGSFASFLVAIGFLIVPQVKARFGYRLAVPATQSVSVLALVLLASTELFKNWQLSLVVALFCYVIRQPLMNMAAPMTSEVVMNYVGEKNREISSALTSAIWSGSWFISSRLFKNLRESGLSYFEVFMATATLYGLGVFLYYLLILDYDRRLKAGKINNQ